MPTNAEAKFAHRLRIFDILRAGDIITRKLTTSEREERGMPLIPNITNYFLVVRVVRMANVRGEMKVEVEPVNLEEMVLSTERELVTTGRYTTIRRRGVYITRGGYADQPHLRFKNHGMFMAWLQKQFRYGQIPAVTPVDASASGTGEE